MFKFEELCELVRLVGSSEVGMIEIEHAGGRLRIEGKAPVAAAPVAMVAAPAPQPSAEAAVAPSASPAAIGADSPVDAVADENLHYVTSPIVGTFYRSPNPDADPYVKVGDAVDGGRTLCIIEAMKLMNEIESDRSGTVVKVFPENAQPVEFGERLFAIKVS
ncbi:MAG: acetyl-CoA carboxylase biotin carboxyl carrier protein [Candidatus Sulfomarinibacteraceae bacterium]